MPSALSSPLYAGFSFDVMLVTVLPRMRPLRAKSTAGFGPVSSKPIATMPMLSLSWTLLFTTANPSTLPLMLSDSLQPRVRWSSSLSRMVTLVSVALLPLLYRPPP